MTINDDIRIYHANAEKHHLKFPEGTEFPELYELTEEESLIPVSEYTSQEFLQQELEKVWYRSWQVACRQEEVPNTGDYFEYNIGTQSFLVVRGEDHVIRAFHNSCRHRGTLLKLGTGNATNLTCSFHAWCFSLKGELVDIPDRHLFPGVTNEAYSLREVGCDLWAGFVFIHPDPERAAAQPLREFLGRVAVDVDVYHMESYRATMQASIELKCNWKAAIEAFIEAYHVSFTHPQILAYLDDVNTVLEVFGDHSRMIVPYGVPCMRLEHVDEAEIYESYFNKSATSFRHKSAAGLPDHLFDEHGEWMLDEPIRDYMIEHHATLGRESGHDYSELTREQLVDDYDYHIFPGFKFNSHAGAALAFRSRPHPTDPDRCIFDVYKLVWPNENESIPEPAPWMNVDISQQSMGLVLDQDFGNLEKVQRGMHDSTLDHVTFGAPEVRIANFHKVIHRMIAED
ncbi:aromatic ring-hydroxylating dioxygenase subunit alpha [Microbacterium sp. zg.B48]|uniref:aromatic ring-hydroxylating oxygenase subunit alpha n=1 Tax=Microbacterium sp. zg.B48 TaxID=2969408 RepID=UPI00214CBBE0|nr:aromatic ring-hydroxylating dioxygenase subunit alpha [Microbacterium sp. zg.B48]MCR2764338.1 aromatic ring-hydroxylating dioxygenase subunit alpha [Microbacterium sp. zg.B48]